MKRNFKRKYEIRVYLKDFCMEWTEGPFSSREEAYRYLKANIETIPYYSTLRYIGYWLIDDKEVSA